jgi:hypothetical protein
VVFLFFINTAPTTVPGSPGRRPALGGAAGATAALLIAPQTTEFGAKVGLLSALTIATVARVLLVRAPAVGRALDAAVAPIARRSRTSPADVRGMAIGFAVPVGAIAVAAAVVVLGGPARRAVVAPVEAAGLPELASIVDWHPPPSLPAITADPAVAMFGADHLGEAKQREIAVALLRGLAVEAEVIRRRDPRLLPAIDHGSRLDELRAVIDHARGSVIETDEYAFDELRLVVVRRGRQSGALIGVEARGASRTVVRRSDGAIAGERTGPVALVVAMRQTSDGRWLIADLDRLDR